MATRFQEAVEELTNEIKAKEQEIVELKKTANFLRLRDGLDPLYSESELSAAKENRGLTTFRPDQYYGKSPVTAAREYLEARGQAVTADEIAEALERGAFDFKTQGWISKAAWGRNLAISMSKNSGIFHRLPNGYYGLVKWYPELKKKKRPEAAPDTEEPEEEAMEELLNETEDEGRAPSKS